MEYGLKLETQQKLVMTQELRQAITILQLSAQELSAMVQEQFLENPALEIEAGGGDELEAPPKEKETDYTFEEIGDMDNYLNRSSNKIQDKIRAEDKASFEMFASVRPTLHEHLELQLDLVFNNSVQNAVGRYLIGCIDGNGYLRSSIAEAAAKMNVTAATAESVLAVIQTFEPDGVGARNLQECLTIQAKQRGVYEGLVAILLDKYLPEIAEARYKMIAEQLSSTPQAVQAAVDCIKKLDPKPGLAFAESDTRYIVPDITVKRMGREYAIILNDYGMPGLGISKAYRTLDGSLDSQTQKYIESRFNAALWLLKSIEQRRNTLRRVMQALVELQREFFDKGPQFMKSLVMKTVADKLDIHESTVSRAVANKHVDTPYGIVSMRAFFTNGIKAADGEEVVVAQIKQELKKLVAAEDPVKPLSDQNISDLLTARGIGISRRTVTKYRKELGIDPSGKRKRY